MNVFYKTGPDVSELSVGDRTERFEPGAQNFRKALDSLGVPYPTQGFPKVKGPRYDAREQRNYFKLIMGDIVVEFSISDREMSVAVPAAVVEQHMVEIVDGTYWKDQVEEGTGSENPGPDHQVPETA